MSSKPKAADYKPSEAEKASASVAMAEYEYFKQKYDPLLQEMRDKSLTENVQSSLRGRANADVMQAISTPSLQQATSSTAASDMAQALTGQLNTANVSAKQVQNTMQTGVLGTARGQAADAQSGMAQASRLATSSALERARANQQVAQAKQSAAGQVAAAAITKAAENIASGGKWYAPKDPKTGELVTGLGDRLRYSTYGTTTYGQQNQPQQLGGTPLFVPGSPLGFYSPTGGASAFNAATPTVKKSDLVSTPVVGIFGPRG
jgi:hypothetical protein